MQVRGKRLLGMKEEMGLEKRTREVRDEKHNFSNLNTELVQSAVVPVN